MKYRLNRKNLQAAHDHSSSGLCHQLSSSHQGEWWQSLSEDCLLWSPVPTTWIGLEKWLQELWRAKDQMLANVYGQKLKFPALSSKQHLPQPVLPSQYVVLFAFFAFMSWSFKITLCSFNLTLWLWILVSGGLMAFVSNYTNGIQDFEVELEAKGIFSTLKSIFVKPKSDWSEIQIIEKTQTTGSHDHSSSGLCHQLSSWHTSLHILKSVP